MLNNKYKNKQKKPESPTKLGRNFHPRDLLQAPLSTFSKLQTLIENQIRRRGKCSLSQGTMGKRLGVTREQINRLFQRIKEDPRYAISYKWHSVCWIYFSCMASSLQVANITQYKDIRKYNYSRNYIIYKKGFAMARQGLAHPQKGGKPKREMIEPPNLESTKVGSSSKNNENSPKTNDSSTSNVASGGGWNYPFPPMPDFFGFWLDTYEEKLELWAASYGYFKPRE